MQIPRCGSDVVHALSRCKPMPLASGGWSTTGRRRIKKLLKRAGRLKFLNLGVVESLSLLARFGPLGPKLDSLVVAAAFAEINFMEKVSSHARRACLARSRAFCVKNFRISCRSSE